MLYIRTPNEPCAFTVCSHHPSDQLCLIYHQLYSSSHIFIDLVIYSSSIAHHTHTYTQVPFSLASLKHHRTLHLLYQACLYIEKLAQTARVC